MGDEITRLRPQMYRKAVGAEPFGQMVHHPVVVERELQAERLAQQRDPADLPLGKLAFERGAEVVTGDDAHLAGVTTAGKAVAAAEQRERIRHKPRTPERAGRAMLRQMVLDRLSCRF